MDHKIILTVMLLHFLLVAVSANSLLSVLKRIEMLLKELIHVTGTNRSVIDSNEKVLAILTAQYATFNREMEKAKKSIDKQQHSW